MKNLFEYWDRIPLWPRRAIVLAFVAFVAIQGFSVITTGEPTGLDFLEFIGLKFWGGDG